jgi:hypothetical protein
MALLHHAFLFSAAEFLDQCRPCWRNGSLDEEALHEAAVRARVSPSPVQLSFLELIRFDPDWWMARGDDQEEFRWLLVVLSGTPSLRHAPSLSERDPSGFILLREALAALSWEPAEAEAGIRGQYLENLLTAAGFQVPEPLARGLRLMPGYLSPSEADKMVNHLIESGQDRERMTRASDAVAAYCRDRAIAPLSSAQEVIDDFSTMLNAAKQSGDSLLMGVFD